ncbi:MAG: DNA repair protein RecN [Trueperaceae bacterium]
MLHTLELHDFAIVDRLELDLSPGLNVLTGETGAGKSIVVDALQLLAGGRPDAGMIRGGADAGLVQATFQAADVQSAARRLSQNGRHTARVNGELVTVSELAERVGGLVVVFGQHAAQELQSAQAQRRQLDRLLPAEAKAALERYRANFDRLGEVQRRLEVLHEAERERSRRLDALTFQLNEIDGVAPRPEEHGELRTELSTLQHAERVQSGAAAAFAALNSEEPSAVALTAEAVRDLEAAGRYAPPLAQLAAELKDALAALGAVSSEVEAFLADFEADPRRLDAVQARLAALEALIRKYGPDLAAVLAYRAQAAAELEELAGADSEIQRLEREATDLDTALTALAAEVSAARQAAATRLSAEVVPLLKQLGMPQARFEVEVVQAPKRLRHGVDQVTFLFSANAGEPSLPVAAVASGGELSRIMLALNLVTGSDVPTLAFDEVDAGVGGATANHVAKLLARLAEGHQVLVVTHLAQVAAYATAHFVVHKAEAAGRTVTAVRRVGQEERPEELARMLSGTVTDASLQHARELLAAAAGTVPT